MKKLLFLFVVLLQSTFIFAQNSRGTSEIFIQIPERGNYVVYVDDEFAGSAKGRFRFYDVRNNYPTVIVMKDNAEIFRRRISLPMNSRLVASYSPRTGWRNITTLNIYDRGQYALDNWDRPIFNERPNQGQNPGRYDELMNPEEFQQLLAMVKKESFSDEQKKFIKVSLKNTMMTTDQVFELLKVLKFDGDRLEMAKYAYPFLADKRNALKLSAAFGFSLSKQEFVDFVDKQKS